VTLHTYAHLSNDLVYSAMATLTLALLAFSAELAFGDRGRVAKTSRLTVHRAPVEVAVGAGGGPVDLQPAEPAGPDGLDEPDGPEPTRAARLGGIGFSLTVLSFLLLLAAVVFRGLAAGRAPWGNMYEFSLASALVVTGAYVIAVWRRPVLRLLGVFIVVPVLLTLGLAVTVLYVDAGPLVPALKSYWLVIHVAAAIISGGVFTLGGAVTVLYLLQERWERRGISNSLSRRLPESEQLDRTAYRLFAFVFPLWTFAIVAGAIWAENAWGRYWGWDPKETWAFVTWVVFAGYLHARATAGWKGRRAAMIALLGLSAFIFNYFGVNIFFSGLHSYGGLPNK
jgi:cytochrome c-type biogenesis protein CcsB